MSLFSSCGCPEGCALAVVSMAICKMAIEVWMYQRVQMYSSIDNIDALANSASEAIEAMAGLSDFCSLLDLQVDNSKIYLWSRKAIQTQGHNCKYYARDVGGHMSYNRIRSNCTVQEKIEAIAPFWSKLARSSAPQSQKERASMFRCGLTCFTRSVPFPLEITTSRNSALKPPGL